MEFIDTAKIFLKAGKGGNGCISYYYKGKKKIASGGNGGKGGSIYLKGNSNLNSLYYIRYHPHQKASHGKNGKAQNQNGKAGEDKIIEVPLGTMVFRENEPEMICELLTEDKIMLLKGGSGGTGNQNFKLSDYDLNKEKNEGKIPREEIFLIELKIIADISLIGLPNAGKSTFISKVSNQKPKIADYPFTSLNPSLGVVELPDYKTLTIADIPGLIEGAHKGKGLGHLFLKHIQRTKFLFFIIDAENDTKISILDTFKLLRNELKFYSKKLLTIKFIVILNKQDKIENYDAINKKIKYLEKQNIKVFLISCKTRYGIKLLLNEMQNIIKN